jgi:phage baseplate assembly protein W
MPQSIYSDIDFKLDLLLDASNNATDVAKKEDINDIFQSIKNIILTSKYERPFSDVGGGLYEYKFEKINPVQLMVLRQTIFSTLQIVEPRAIINSIEMTQPIPETLLININFSPSYDPSIKKIKSIQV